jgi:hypothetical protein
MLQTHLLQPQKTLVPTETEIYQKLIKFVLVPGHIGRIGNGRFSPQFHFFHIIGPGLLIEFEIFGKKIFLQIQFKIFLGIHSYIDSISSPDNCRNSCRYQIS